MIINHNLSSLFASKMEGFNSQALQKSMEKLSSGERINRAGDDASGLSISEKMRSQIRGLNQASRNIGDAISFTNVAEGYLQETTDVLQRIRELAVQASNSVYSDEDRAQIAVEVSQLVAEIDRIASSAEFNGMHLLTGRFAKESDTVMQFQAGANADQNIRAYIGTMTAQALGLTSIQGTDEKISISSSDDANTTISILDEAIKNVNKQRADLGAYSSRMEMAQKGISISAENLTSAESRIRDTDVATELVNYSKNQILVESSSAMLAQSLNINRSAVAKLLG